MAECSESSHSSHASPSSKELTITTDFPRETLTFNWIVKNFENFYDLAVSVPVDDEDDSDSSDGDDGDGDGNEDKDKLTIATFDFEGGSPSKSKWMLCLQRSIKYDIGISLKCLSCSSPSPDPEDADASDVDDNAHFAAFIVEIKPIDNKGPRSKELGSVDKPKTITLGCYNLNRFTRDSPAVSYFNCICCKLTLADFQNGYLSGIGNKDLVMKITVTIYGKKSEKKIPKTSSLTWLGLFAKRMQSNFATMLETGEHSDVTFSVGKAGAGGAPEKIKAHKFILSAQSPVFAALFASDMLESSSGEVEIKDISPPAMKILVKFLYTGYHGLNGWDSDSDVALELVHAAEKYQLDDLKKFLNENLESVCTPQNAVEIFYVARLYKLPRALEFATDFIKNLE